MPWAVPAGVALHPRNRPRHHVIGARDKALPKAKPHQSSELTPTSVCYKMVAMETARAIFPGRSAKAARRLTGCLRARGYFTKTQRSVPARLKTAAVEFAVIAILIACVIVVGLFASDLLGKFWALLRQTQKTTLLSRACHRAGRLPIPIGRGGRRGAHQAARLLGEPYDGNRCYLISMAGEEGLEPPTPGFGDRCSNQLSYTPTKRVHAATRGRKQGWTVRGSGLTSAPPVASFRAPRLPLVRFAARI